MTSSDRDADQLGDESPLVAAADGSALGNPGPAGWAWYVDEHTWRAGGWPHGTNNMGELKAVLDLVEQTADQPDRELRILCDSQYVINCVTRWMPGWKKNGWKKKDKKPVLNRELLEALDAALAGRKYTFEWVKGHAGHALNEAADERARAAATAYQRGEEPDRGPGLTGTAMPRAVEGRSTAGGFEEPAGSAGGASTTPGVQPARSQEPLAESDRLTSASPSAEAEDLDEAEDLELALTDPEVYGDPDRLAEFLDEDLAWVTAKGRLTDKTTALRYPEAAFRATSGLDILRTSAPHESTRLVVSRLQTPRGIVLRSSLWAVRATGRWVLVLRQDTPQA